MARRRKQSPMPVNNARTNGHAVNNGMDVITQYQLQVRNQKLLTEVKNAVTSYISREELRRSQPDRRRNINDECGYPDDITSQWYQDMYDRDPIGKRVVQVMPLESWQTIPSIFEDDDPKVETEFEAAFKSLGDMLRGEQSHYKAETGNPVWEYLRRADIVSGIGSYGILLLGIDDGKKLSEPIDCMPPDGDPDEENSTGSTPIYNADGVPKEIRQKHRLLYLRPYSESLAPVAKFEQSRRNPRYGQPVSYDVTTVDPSLSTGGAVGAPTATFNVHWTRVIHLTDGLDTSEYFAAPRMQSVWNRLMDLQKLYGGSAEMYWKGAFPGVVFGTHPNLGGDVEVDADDMEDQIEQLFNGLQRFMITKGFDPKVLNSVVVDPSPQIDKIIEAICIVLGIPKRIFMGSERGELASSQDDSKWNDRLADRQEMYLTPRVIVPFIDRLINLGILPVPPKGYEVIWPDLNVMSDKERAEVAKSETESLVAYAESRASELIKPYDYLSGVMRWEDDRVESTIDNAMEALASEEEGLLDPPEVPEQLQPDDEGEGDDVGTPDEDIPDDQTDE